MSVLRHSPNLARGIDQTEIYDHFTWYVTAHQFTTVATDSGTVSVGDNARSIVALVASDGTVADNDETYIKSTNESFLLANGKKLFGEALIQFTEANTDDANIFFGFVDNIAANTLVDDGAGLKTSFSGACIYKVDGGTVWKCVSSNGATQTVSTSTTTAGGSAYQLLQIEFNDDTSLQCRVTFKVDGRYLRDSSGAVIRHTVLYASATEMQIGAGVKNGGANLETLNIDYMYGAQKFVAN